ncbi:MAG: hypothetical protein WC494_02145 [Candidatus Pacearchaeota archaeon]
MEKVNFFFFLSVLLFIFSLLSLANTYKSLAELGSFTGKAVDDGEINITIEEVAMINFTIDSINWGTGSVFSNASFASLDTLGDVSNGTWTPVESGFIIKNIGNLNISLSFTTGKNADSFISGTSPSYKYMISNIDEGACVPPSGFNLSEFYEIPSPGTPVEICESFSVGSRISFDLAIQIPQDSLIGNLSDEVSVSFEQA